MVLFILFTEKNGFATATKLGNTFFVAASKRFVNRTKHFVVVTKCFVIPILTNDFVSITKPFFPCFFQETLRYPRYTF